LLGKTLNLGILAHVDAGKTTLTERLLYEAGVIDAIGSVDHGTTQTDSLALEQQRGITIKSAVASFAIGDVAVNLIDTPGHPDFIAEVERVLSVLDGAVLVLSAVEGVQPQTVLLMRALTRLRVPTLMFVNKIDRAGAGYDRVLDEIRVRLTPQIAAMGSVREIGTRAARFAASTAGIAEAVAAGDEALLGAYVDDELSDARAHEQLVAQTAGAAMYPVFFGSALTGAGVDAVMAGIAELLPVTAGDPDGPLSGTVFKVERGPTGEKIAYVRMFSGTLRVRDPHGEQKVTGIGVFDSGTVERRASVSAGEIAKVSGLGDVRIGDAIGADHAGAEHHFPPPTLQTVVVPRRPEEKGALRVALTQLAEQDPLIDVRQDDRLEEISVSLYGEVQKEVIDATLASEYGLDVTFEDATPIYIERPLGTGHAVEVLHAESNPFSATIGLRVDPAPDGSAVEFRLRVDRRTAPLYLYKTVESFSEHMAEYVRQALRAGPSGWEVMDCVVTMTECAYSIPDGPPSRRGPRSTAADFRKLTPLVLMQALERAGTVVCEPLVRVSLELPANAIAAVMRELARLGGAIDGPSVEGGLARVETVVPAVRVHELQRHLPVLTGGEGVLESSFAGYQALDM